MFKRLRFFLKKSFYRHSVIDTLNGLLVEYAEPNGQRRNTWVKAFRETKQPSDVDLMQINDDIKKTLVYHEYRFNLHCHISREQSDGFISLTLYHQGMMDFFTLHYYDIPYFFKVLNGHLGLDVSLARFLLHSATGKFTE